MSLKNDIKYNDELLEKEMKKYNNLIKEAAIFNNRIKNIEKRIEELEDKEKFILKFKKLHIDAIIPERAHEGDAGYDLTAIEEPNIVRDETGILYIEYKTGLAVQPPKGFRTEIYPRSSISKYNLSLCNSIALIDGIYTGELICRFNLIKEKDSIFGDMRNRCLKKPIIKPKIYKKGDKIAQLVIKKDYIFEVIEVDNLDETERGDGNFGSTGIS